MGTTYETVLKTTFLFGFVQVYRAVVSIIKNKIAAILIGPEGLGLIGIFNSTIDLIRTIAGLGLNQSAVRDVAEAYGSNDETRISRIIKITNKAILFSGLIGCLATLILSNRLSVWTLGDATYTVSYCILSFAIAFYIINEGKQALLKGARQLRALAISSIIGSSVSLITASLLYYFFKTEGIVPELLTAAIVGLLTTAFFVRKIPVNDVFLSPKDIIIESKPMLKMGIALMYVTLLQVAANFLINAYVRSNGGLIEVGYFNVGATVLGAYFGLVVSAISTDYYPRISAVNMYNDKIQEELNHQSIISIVLVGPMFVIFMSFLDIWIKILYSTEFLPAIGYIKYAIYWFLITVCSNQVDMILVAKFKTKVMTVVSTIMRVFQLLLAIPLYKYFGLEGLGLTFLILGIMHVTVMSTIVYQLYHIRFSNEFIRISGAIFIMAFFSSLIYEMFDGLIRLIFSISNCLIAISFSYYIIRNKIKIDISSYVVNKFYKSRA